MNDHIAHIICNTFTFKMDYFSAGLIDLIGVIGRASVCVCVCFNTVGKSETNLNLIKESEDVGEVDTG